MSWRTLFGKLQRPTTVVEDPLDAISGTSVSGKHKWDAVAFGTGMIDYSLWAELSFACSNLLNKDVLSLSDPFLVLSLHTKVGLREIGRTEIVPNNLNPKFVRSFQVLYEFERVQKMRVEVYDADENKDVKQLNLSQQDFLGRIDFKMSELVTESEGKVVLPLLDKDDTPMQSGSITIFYEEQSNQSDEVKLDLAATVQGKVPSAFYRVSRQHFDETWLPTYRSEVLQATSHENAMLQWKPMETQLRSLCNANRERTFMIEILSYKKRGSHQLIGQTFLTLRDLEERTKDTFELTNGKNIIGTLHVKNYERKESPSFLEYVASGFEICFLIGIDFTKSNGLPEFPGSLHHISDNATDSRVLNVYEEVIYGVGEVLESYDTDKLFPTWGFGAKLDPASNAVNHCFAVNGDDAHPECRGIKGIIEAYRSALKRVTLAGPTLFGPVLKAAAMLAAIDSEKKYYCLLLITDGVLQDMPKAKREIIAASSLPLSIMIVGVGNEDFQKMKELDSDDQLLSEDGVYAERDIVQFVEFEKYKNDGQELARELLAEFPGQFLSYMKKHDIVPEKKAPKERPPEPSEQPEPATPPEETTEAQEQSA